MEQKTQTIRDFITECECYEYSQEHYDLMKEAYEIDLMERYIANQAFVLENADVINTEDGYTFTEGMFVESSSIDTDQTVALMEATEEKKQGFFKKIWEKIKKLFKKLVGFFKSILTKEGRANRKAAKEMWDSIGGDKGVMEYLKQLGNDTKYAQKLVDDKADETGINDYQRDRLKRRVKKLAKKNGPTKDATPTEDEYEYNKESVEFTEAVKSNGASDVMQDIADKCSKGNRSGAAILNAVNKKIFAMKPQLKEFFDPSSSRNIVYAIDFGTASKFNKIVDVIANNTPINIKIIKNAKNDPILTTEKFIEGKKMAENITNESELIKTSLVFYSAAFSKKPSKFKVDLSNETLKEITDQGNLLDVYESMSAEMIESLKTIMDTTSALKFTNNFTTAAAEMVKFVNALIQYKNTFCTVVAQLANDVKKVKVTKVSK